MLTWSSLMETSGKDWAYIQRSSLKTVYSQILPPLPTQTRFFSEGETLF